MSKPRFIILDFETYYADGYILKDMATPLFITDKRFKVHGMAVDDGKGQYFVPAKDVRKTLEKYKDDVLVFHNAFFDLGVLAWHYKFRPAFVLDTLLLANHVLGSARDQGKGKNDLASLAIRLGLPDRKGTEIKDFKGVRTLDEMQYEILAAYARRDAKLTRQVLNVLLPQVGNQEFELWLLDHTLRIYSEKLLGVDMAKLVATREKVEVRRAELLKASGASPACLSSNKQFSAELKLRLQAAGMKPPMKQRLTTPTEMRKLREKKLPVPKFQSVPAQAKADMEFIGLADCGVPEVEALVKARLAERSAITVRARLDTMERYAKAIGGVPVHLVYYGAHTGRFAGGGGFNFQNLTSPGRAATQFDRDVATMIRECLIPLNPDDTFVAVDAAQIEARVLAWLAGEVELLERFEQGQDVYSMFIADVMGREVRKPTKEDPPAKAVQMKLDRNIGKEAVLGLGFSMGVDKFEFRLRAMKDLAPLFASGEMNTEKVQEIVTAYRDQHQNIVGFWAALDEAFREAITGATRRVGYLMFRREKPGVVSIELPSTRKLYYRDLRKETEEFMGKRRTVWKHGAGQKIYGGLLAENVTQAVARDILAEQGILASEQAGFPVALHIHDEVVSQVAKSKGQEVHDFLVKSLSTPPEWGVGIPLAAEGGIAPNLAKH